MQDHSSIDEIVIGRTEPTDSRDVERLCSKINELEQEKLEMENTQDQLRHQNLTLKQENNELRRKHRCLEDTLETERNRHEREIRKMQHQLDENMNSFYDLKHKRRLQIELKDEQIRSLTKEVAEVSCRLLKYETEQITDIRARPTKRFKSCIIKDCRRCHSAIIDNNDFKCCYHPEKPVRAPNFTKTNQMMLWKCCYQVSKNEPPGCTTADNHEPAS